MHVSVREVLDLSDRCFTSADFPEGASRAAAEGIWWTEVYRQEGLATLHGLLDDLDEFERSRLSLDAESDSVSVLDTDGQPGLFAVGPAVDLVCSDASHTGTGIAYVRLPEGDETVHTLGHAAFRAADRGYVTLVTATDGSGTASTVVAVPDQPHPLLATADLVRSSVAHRDLRDVVERGLHDAHHNVLTQAAFTREQADRHPVAEARLLARLLERATEPADGDDVAAGVCIVSIDPGHPAQPDRVRHAADRVLTDRSDRFSHVFDPEDVQQHVDELLEEGVDITEDVWRDVFECSSGFLPPEFEGSLEGAGVDINE